MSGKNSKYISWLWTQKPAKFGRSTIIAGGAHDVYFRTISYYGGISFIANFGTFYAVVVMNTPWLSWITLPMFIALLLAGFVIIAVIVWKFIIPLTVAYGNYQGAKHSSVVLGRLEELDKKYDLRLQDIEKHMDDKLNEVIGNLEIDKGR